MKSARGLLAALVVLGSVSLALAGCAAAADGGARAAAADQSPRSGCAPSYWDRCARGGVGDGGDDWGGDHWWRLDRFHQVSDLPDFGHGNGALPGGGAGSVVKRIGLT